MRSAVGTRDGEWLDFVADLMQSPITDWPAERVSRLFVATFDLHGAVFHEHAPHGLDHQHAWPPEHFAPYREEQLHWTRHEAAARHPLLRYHLTTRRDTCMQVDDVPSGIADRRIRADWHALGRRWGGVQSQLSIPVRSGPGGLSSFVLGRPDPYTTQEMATARRVQQLLRGLDRRIGLFTDWSATRPVDALDAAGAVHLTPRELVVLDLLARSLTAAAIARRMAVAERTVQKHLQRIYRKLGAADRLGAVRRAEYLGLVQPPARTQFTALPPG